MNEWEWHLLEAKKPVDDLRISGIGVRPGSRVKLRPRAGGDVMDIALTGRLRSLSRSSRITRARFISVSSFDDDPGRDIGMLRQPGHRFFLYSGGS